MIFNYHFLPMMVPMIYPFSIFTAYRTSVEPLQKSQLGAQQIRSSQGLSILVAEVRVASRVGIYNMYIYIYIEREREIYICIF